MKKIICLLVAAIFLISIAAIAFAEENATETDNATVTAVSEDNGQKLTQKSSKDFEQKRSEFIQQAQAKRQELIQKRDEARAHIGEDIKNFKAKRAELRENYLSKKADLKEKASKARERVEEAKEKHKEAKARLAEKKDQLKECKGSDTDECVTLRADAKKDAGEFLANIADNVLAMLERAQERVDKSKLSEEEKVSLKDQLELKMAEIASTKDSIDAFTENTTKEEVAEAAKTIRDIWKDAKDLIKKSAGLAASDRLGGVIVKAEKLQAKLEKAISKLKGKGADVSKAEELKSSFDAKLAEAKALHEEAKALFNEGKVPEAAQKTQDAHAALKEAHSILKDIVKELKGTKEGVEALDTTEETEGTAVTGTAAIADETSGQANEAAEETAEEGTEVTGSTAAETGETTEPADETATEDNSVNDTAGEETTE